MTKNEKTLWTRIYMYIRPEPMSAGHFWGRFSRVTFIISCHVCGLNMLVSKGAFKHIISLQNSNENFSLFCPSCGKSTFHFSNTPYLSDEEKFRKKWKWYFQCNSSDSNTIINPINTNQMISVLLDDNKYCPRSMPSICLKEDKFPTDLNITIDVMLPPLGTTKAALRYISKAVTNKENHLVLRYRDESNKVQEIEL